MELIGKSDHCWYPSVENVFVDIFVNLREGNVIGPPRFVDSVDLIFSD